MARKIKPEKTWREWLGTDISMDVRCRIFVAGTMGAEEIENLIEVLNITKRAISRKPKAPRHG